MEIEVRPANNDKRLTPPTKLKNGWFAKPFSMFVEMYGVPNYKDLDPTFFVALTYTILFGIMFGDVGQGALLSIGGYLLYKFKGMQLGAVGARIGISSIFFGFLYVMYSFIMVGAGLLLGGITNLFNIVTIILFIIVPLVLIFLKEAIERKVHNEKMFPDGFGGFFTEAFFELFEIVLSYITNTMSYMRVAGFVLTHAGMMLVVYTLMDMAGSAGPVVFVFGNLFVMALEILIVGIQVLRLEFYEMFSRYYTGDGISFKSLKESI